MTEGAADSNSTVVWLAVVKLLLMNKEVSTGHLLWIQLTVNGKKLLGDTTDPGL